MPSAKVGIAPTKEGFVVQPLKHKTSIRNFRNGKKSAVVGIAPPDEKETQLKQQMNRKRDVCKNAATSGNNNNQHQSTLPHSRSTSDCDEQKFHLKAFSKMQENTFDFKEDTIVEHFHITTDFPHGVWRNAIVVKKFNGKKYRLLSPTGESLTVPSHLIRKIININNDNKSGEDKDAEENQKTGNNEESNMRLGADGTIYTSVAEFTALTGRGVIEYQKLTFITSDDVSAIKALKQAEAQERSEAATKINAVTRGMLARSKVEIKNGRFAEDSIVEVFVADDTQISGTWVSAIVDKCLPHGRYRILFSNGEHCNVPMMLVRVAIDPESDNNESDDTDNVYSSGETNDKYSTVDSHVYMDSNNVIYASKTEFINVHDGNDAGFENLVVVSKKDIEAMKLIQQKEENVAADAAVTITAFARGSLMRRRYSSPRSQSGYIENQIVECFLLDTETPGTWMAGIVDAKLRDGRYRIILSDGKHHVVPPTLLRQSQVAVDDDDYDDDDDDDDDLDSNKLGTRIERRLGKDGKSYSMAEFVATRRVHLDGSTLDVVTLENEWALLPHISPKDVEILQVLNNGRELHRHNAALIIQGAYRTTQLRRELAVTRFEEGEIVLLRCRDAIDAMAIGAVNFRRNEVSGKHVQYQVDQEHCTHAYWEPVVVLQVHQNPTKPEAYATYDIAHLQHLVSDGYESGFGVGIKGQISTLEPEYPPTPPRIELRVHRAMLTKDVPLFIEGKTNNRHIANCVALWDAPETSSKDLHFNMGDVLSIERHTTTQDWFLGHNWRSGRTGDIPANYVRLLPDAYFEIGTSVLAQYMQTDNSFEGIITATHLDHTYDIRFANGNYEQNISWEFVVAGFEPPSEREEYLSEQDMIQYSVTVVRHPFYNKYLPAALEAMQRGNGSAALSRSVSLDGITGHNVDSVKREVCLLFHPHHTVEFWTLDKTTGRLVWSTAIVHSHHVNKVTGEVEYILDAKSTNGTIVSLMVPVNNVKGLFSIGQRVDIISKKQESGLSPRALQKSITGHHHHNDPHLWNWGVITRVHTAHVTALKTPNKSSASHCIESSNILLTYDQARRYDVLIGEDHSLRYNVTAAELAPYEKDFGHGVAVFYLNNFHDIVPTAANNMTLRNAQLQSGFVVSRDLFRQLKMQDEEDQEMTTGMEEHHSINIAPLSKWTVQELRTIAKSESLLPFMSIYGTSCKPLGFAIRSIPDVCVLPRFSAGDAVFWFDVERAAVVKATFVRFHVGLTKTDSERDGIDTETCIVAIDLSTQNSFYHTNSNDVHTKPTRMVRTDHVDRFTPTFDAGEKVEVLTVIGATDKSKDLFGTFQILNSQPLGWVPAVVTGVDVTNQILSVIIESVEHSTVLELPAGYARKRYCVGDIIEWFDTTFYHWRPGTIMEIESCASQEGCVYTIAENINNDIVNPTSNEIEIKITCNSTQLRQLTRNWDDTHQHGSNGVEKEKKAMLKSNKHIELHVVHTEKKQEVQKQKESVPLAEVVAKVAEEELVMPSTLLSGANSADASNYRSRDGDVIMIKMKKSSTLSLSSSLSPKLCSSPNIAIIVDATHLGKPRNSSSCSIILADGNVIDKFPVSQIVQPTELSISMAEAISQITLTQLESFINHIGTHHHSDNTQTITAKFEHQSQRQGFRTQFKPGDDVQVVYHRNSATANHWCVGQVVRCHPTGSVDVKYPDSHVDTFLDPTVHLRPFKRRASKSHHLHDKAPVKHKQIRIPTFVWETSSVKYDGSLHDGTYRGVSNVISRTLQLLLKGAQLAYQEGGHHFAKAAICYGYLDELLEANVTSTDRPASLQINKLRCFVWQSHAYTLQRSSRAVLHTSKIISLLEKAHNLHMSIHGSTERSTAKCICNLAQALYDAGRIVEAIQKFNEAKVAVQTAFGANSIEYGELLINMRTALQDQMILQHNPVIFQRTSQITYEALAIFQRYSQDYPSAETTSTNSSKSQLQKPSSSSSLSVSPPHHTSAVAQQRIAIGLLQTALLLLQNIILNAETSGYDGISLHQAKGSQVLRDLDEADRLLRESLKIRKVLHSISGHHPACAEVQFLQVRVACLRGKYEEALQLCSSTLKIQQAHFGHEHPLTVQTLQWISKVAQVSPNLDAKRLKETYQTILGMSHLAISPLALAIEKFEYANALLRLKDYDTSLYILAKLCKEINAARNKSHPVDIFNNATRKQTKSDDVNQHPFFVEATNSWFAPPLQFQIDVFAALGFCRRMMNRKVSAVEAFRFSAARCQELHHEIIQSDTVTAAQIDRVTSSNTQTSRQHLSRQVQALAKQIRLCGDMEEAIRIYRLGDEIGGIDKHSLDLPKPMNK